MAVRILVRCVYVSYDPTCFFLHHTLFHAGGGMPRKIAWLTRPAKRYLQKKRLNNWLSKDDGKSSRKSGSISAEADRRI